MKLLLPEGTTFEIVPALDDGNDIIATYALSELLPDEYLDAELLVLWERSSEWLADAAQRLANLRWVQSLTAGNDDIANAGFSPDVTVTSGVGLHDVAVAEHALTLILACVRRLGALGAAQRRREWDTWLMPAQTALDSRQHYTLDGARVTVLGFGSIASRLAGYLKVLGARVTGVATVAGERNGFPVVGGAELDALLPTTDVLVSLLPVTPQTRHALNAARFALLPDHASFVNCGRGATVDELALADALNAGRLAAAAIDVAETEPLPAHSPLWVARNLIVTPHVAGGRPYGVSEFLTSQIRAWKSGGPGALANVIAR